MEMKSLGLELADAIRVHGAIRVKWRHASGQRRKQLRGMMESAAERLDKAELAYRYARWGW